MALIARRALIAAAAGSISQRVPAASDRLRIGMIGCGEAGIRNLDAFLEDRAVECPVICDIDDSRLQRAATVISKTGRPQPAAVKDYRRVLDRQDVDAVCVCTPDHWHALQAIGGCQSGKDVYLETPLATSIVEGEAIVRASATTGRIVMPASYWRSGQHYQAAAEAARSGRLGRIRVIRAWAHLDSVRDIGSRLETDSPIGVDYDMWLGPAPTRRFHPSRFHTNFRWFWDYAGGLMTDQGAQLFDLLQMLTGFGTLRRVTSAGTKNIGRDDSETPETQTALFDCMGVMMLWESQTMGGAGLFDMPVGLSLSGTDATLAVGHCGWRVIPAGAGANAPESTPCASAERAAVRAHIAGFVSSMRNRKTAVALLDAAHRAATLAHLANISLHTGAEVTWDQVRLNVGGPPEARALTSRQYRRPWALPKEFVNEL